MPVIENLARNAIHVNTKNALAKKIACCYMYCMQKQDTSIAIRVNREWLAKLDAWIAAQPIRPSRTEAIRVAVNRLMNEKRKQK